MDKAVLIERLGYSWGASNQNQSQNSHICPENWDISVTQQPEDGNITVSNNSNGGIEVTRGVTSSCANP